MDRYKLIMIALTCACALTGIAILRSSPTPMLIFSVMAVCLTVVCFVCVEMYRARK